MIPKSSIEPIRSGVISSFPNVKALEDGLSDIITLLPPFSLEEFKQRHGSDAQAPNVVYITLRHFEPEDDQYNDQLRETILRLVQANEKLLQARGVRRATFMLCRREQYPWYYTVRKMETGWAEEESIRNIEPALAYQLELGRLSNYKLTPCFVENRQIHIYHGVARENQFDSRFFVRALVRPGRLRGTMSTAEYLVS